MYCRKCGREIPDDSVFCPVCGADLGISEPICDNEEAAAKPSDTQRITNDSYISDEQFIEKKKPHNKKKTTILIVAATILAVLAGVFLLVILPEMHLELGYVLSSDGENYFVTGYRGSGKNVAVPDTIWFKPVTAITASAFQGTDIESVTIGKNVEIIGESAFQDCTELKSVKPNKYGETGNMKVIMENAFMNCTSLTEVELHRPNRYQKYSFQNNAFYGCVSLRSIGFSNVNEIGDSAFYNCDSLESLQFDGAVLGIGSGVVLGTGAFQDCDGLFCVTIKDTYVPGYCFSSCGNLERFIGNNISSIGEYAFEGCEKLAEVNLEETSEENIAATAFDGCTLLKPKSQINKYGATNLIGMTESEMFDLLGYDYEYNGGLGSYMYTYYQYGLSVADNFYYDPTIKTVYVLNGGYVSSGLGGIDFVKVGMTLGEIFEYIGQQDFEFRYGQMSPGGGYDFRYDIEGYSFYFSTSFDYEHEVPDPENCIVTNCAVQKMEQ